MTGERGLNPYERIRSMFPGERGRKGRNTFYTGVEEFHRKEGLRPARTFFKLEGERKKGEDFRDIRKEPR